MKEKSTDELKKVLGETSLKDFESFCKENKESMLSEARSFPVYIKDILSQKGITQQRLFIRADIPERYGYKLLSGEKRTRQRDVILRICYAAEMTLEETQRALQKYQLPELYPKIPRDALLMIVFNERPGTIIDVNTFLQKNGMDTLRTSGVQE